MREPRLPSSIVALAVWVAVSASGGTTLQPPNSKAGYLARLLINEAPFPGEHRWLSEANTKAAMLSILWVLHARIHHVPKGYRQEQIAAVRSSDVIDVITAGGEKGQCDGFYRNRNGRFVTVPRVNERIDRLLRIANDGKPGRFARLLDYAQGLASAYVKGGIKEADRFAGLRQVGNFAVTGRAYSWMADRDYYNPGGNFVKIPDRNQGALGGNRFFTLRKIDQ